MKLCTLGRAGLMMVTLAAPFATAASARAAAALEDNEAVGKVTLLNRKAIEAYQNLNFDEAQRLLREALTLTDARGLAQHAIKARTCVTLGMVMLGGFKQREEAIRLFQQGLQISPEIRPSRALANPQIQEVFDEAVKRMASAPIDPVGGPPIAASPELPEDKLLVHEPITTGARGRSISVETTPDPSLVRDLLVLGYRPAGAAIFTEVRLQRRPGGVHAATIPASATAGGQIEYYLEARHANGKRVASRGSSIDPIVVTLMAAPASGSRAEPALIAGAAAAGDGAGEHRFVFALLAGTGLGWTTGMGEVRQVQVTPSGLAWASLGHLAPELGYYVTPHLLVGVQGRIQLVSGAQEFRPSEGPTPGVCGGDGVCSPARAAFAGLGKASWFFRDPKSAFRPYLSASLGGGQIRHVAQAGNKADCGSTQSAKCFDTVAGGPFLFGAGVGFSYALSQSLAAMFAVEGLGAMPDFTAQADVNLGVSFRFQAAANPA
jgi:hypothetical protein